MLYASLKLIWFQRSRGKSPWPLQNWAGRRHLPGFISRSMRLNIMAQKDILHPLQTNRHPKAREYNYAHLSPGFFKSPPWMPPSSLAICVTSYSKHLAPSNMVHNLAEGGSKGAAQHSAWHVLTEPSFCLSPHRISGGGPGPHALFYCQREPQWVRVWLRTVTEAAFSK